MPKRQKVEKYQKKKIGKFYTFQEFELEREAENKIHICVVCSNEYFSSCSRA